MSASLKGKRVVIIGASSGIGLATAQLLGHNGASLIVAARNKERLQHITNSISTDVEAHHVEVADEQSVAGFFEQIGEFEHLVVPADGAVLGTLADSRPNRQRCWLNRSCGARPSRSNTE